MSVFAFGGDPSGGFQSLLIDGIPEENLSALHDAASAGGDQVKDVIENIINSDPEHLYVSTNSGSPSLIHVLTG